jgi:primosomal protein N' (replication factor Y) (superfamily II helicase)
MTGFGVARVAIDSPLPQLDRLFDYEIADALRGTIAIGSRVRVPFGRSAGLSDGFVVELVESSDFNGKLARLEEVVSSVSVLTPEIYALCRAIADRQAVTIADVFKLAIPTRSVAVEKKWQSARAEAATLLMTRVEPAKPAGNRSFAFIEPRTNDHGPIWVQQLANRAVASIQSGQSTILVVPDFRDQAVVLEQLRNNLGDAATAQLVDYTSQQSNSLRYAAFLRCLTGEPIIVVGSRAALYAPVANLGEIIVWDDGDSNLQEPTSPYTNARDVALIRQSQSGCNLLFAAHARSCEAERLVEIGYLKDISIPFAVPKLAISETSARVDSLAWQTIRRALDQGEAVLVQVASRGQSVSVYCGGCAERAKCTNCAGPLWVDSQGQPRCSWCNAHNLAFSCTNCGNRTLKQGRAGATRTTAEFGKAFAGTKIIESNGDNRLESLPAGKKIVVSTPEAEPRIQGGYGAVILLDCNEMLSRDNLRASEDAVRIWSNTIALMKPGGLAVAVGLQGFIGQKLALWSQAEIAKHEYHSRAELRFPPFIRMASLAGERDLLTKVLEALPDDIEILGPMPLTGKGAAVDDWRALIRYEYSQGANLAATLKAQVLLSTAGAKRVSAKSGRAQRPIQIKMDTVI